MATSVRRRAVVLVDSDSTATSPFATDERFSDDFAGAGVNPYCVLRIRRPTNGSTDRPPPGTGRRTASKGPGMTSEIFAIDSTTVAYDGWGGSRRLRAALGSPAANADAVVHPPGGGSGSTDASRGVDRTRSRRYRSGGESYLCSPADLLLELAVGHRQAHPYK
jgi:hypothetical protein